jgi:hypothetical protein
MSGSEVHGVGTAAGGRSRWRYVRILGTMPKGAIGRGWEDGGFGKCAADTVPHMSDRPTGIPQLEQ